MAKLLLGKLLHLLHGVIVVWEVAVITAWGNCYWGHCCWGNCCWGNWLLGKLLLGKLSPGSCNWGSCAGEIT